MGIGYIIQSEDGQVLFEEGRMLVGKGTNNIAEYQALISALKRAQELGVRKVAVFGDSDLVVKQVMGQWKAKHAHLAALKAEVQDQVRKFDFFLIKHIPRECNKHADRLSNRARN